MWNYGWGYKAGVFGVALGNENYPISITLKTRFPKARNCHPLSASFSYLFQYMNKFSQHHGCGTPNHPLFHQKVG